MKSLLRFITCALMSVMALTTPTEAADDGGLSQGTHSVVIDNLRFVYFVSGTGPLVVVQAPGWGIGSDYLRNGWAPLERQFTMIFYDTRGSGRRTRPNDPATITVATMQEDLERLREYWGIPKMQLLGHSWGGGIAIAYAEHHPERISKLVLVDTSIPGFKYSDIADETHRQWTEAAKDPRLDAAMKNIQTDEAVRTDSEFKKDLETRLPFYVYDPSAAVKFWKTSPSMPSAWVWNAWMANFAQDQRNARTGPQPDTIKVPTLIIEGAEDRLCPPGMARRLHQQIPDSQLELRDGSAFSDRVIGGRTAVHSHEGRSSTDAKTETKPYSGIQGASSRGCLAG